LLKILSCLLAFIVSALPAMAAEDKLVMQAIVYPPLVYEEGSALLGVAPEVVREMQKIVGDASRLEAVPWLRAYQRTQEEPMHAIFAIVRIPEREKLFKWVGPIFGEGDYFFKRKGSPIKVNSLADAMRVAKIAVRKDGYTHQTLEGKGFKNLDIGPTYDSSYRKLLEGRVDLVLMGELTYYYMVKHAGLDPAEFERTGYEFARSSAWLAFSRDVPDALVAKWQEALDTLKASGAYDAIMARNFSTNRKER
jgi:polar amino acid transport system substrate-binding protein